MARFVLLRDENGYGLKDLLSAQRPLRIDFGSLDQRRLRGGKKELLLKAVNAKNGLKVWDCTAGLATDSFLLAAAGCEVTLFERSSIVAMLLEQALNPASEELAVITRRMHLVKDDAKNHLMVDCSLFKARTPDVIIIDPMFPTRRKSARVKGEMQMLQKFLPRDEDALVLLQLAIGTGTARVIVKRPASGAVLPGLLPSFSLSAKANRFDVFLNHS